MKQKDCDVERIPTVSIVADDAFVRKTIERACKSLGFSSKSYDSAEAFLESGDATDCLVSDVGLPGINGLKLQETMRYRQPQVPVFLMTASADRLIESRAFANGAEGVFRKPLEIERLLESIQRILLS
jgi:FixJ family two-component response regulator